MKLPVLCSFALLAAAAASHAGSFGGPPPFTNLSPLQSGIDGSYQATARGENLVGVIRFAYQNGVQSAIPSANQYNFFVAGEVVSGGVTASITGKQLAGVLGGQDFTVPETQDGSTSLPIVFIVQGNRAYGSFEGGLDLEDRMSVFSGSGTITAAPAQTNTIVGINEGTSDFQPPIVVVVTNFVIPESSIVPSDFTFEGVRTSVFAQGTGSSEQATATNQ